MQDHDWWEQAAGGRIELPERRPAEVPPPSRQPPSIEPPRRRGLLYIILASVVLGIGSTVLLVNLMTDDEEAPDGGGLPAASADLGEVPAGGEALDEWCDALRQVDGIYEDMIDEDLATQQEAFGDALDLLARAQALTAEVVDPSVRREVEAAVATVRQITQIWVLARSEEEAQVGAAAEVLEIDQTDKVVAEAWVSDHCDGLWGDRD